MNKQDREYVKAVVKQLEQTPNNFSDLVAPDLPNYSVVVELCAIIERLDKQLTEIVEKGEPFVEALSTFDKEHIVHHGIPLDIRICAHTGKDFYMGQLVAFVKVLKEVKDEWASE